MVIHFLFPSLYDDIPLQYLALISTHAVLMYHSSLNICLCYSDATCQWNVWVPRDISAMTNSCVVIPCTFMYPSGIRPYRGIHGIWYFGQPYPQLFPPVVFKSRTDVVHESYKGRTKLLGDLHQRNCTLLINNIGTEHSGRYYFRADLGGANMYTFPDFAELKVLGKSTTREEYTFTKGQVSSSYCVFIHFSALTSYIINDQDSEEHNHQFMLSTVRQPLYYNVKWKWPRFCILLFSFFVISIICYFMLLSFYFVF